MENQPTIRLSFTCNRNWEDMTAVAGGRFCNNCQKRVVDFTDKTNDEIAAYLMSSTTQVCGKFTASQLNSSPPKTFWKRWLSVAAVFAVFMGIKEASAQQLAQAKGSSEVKISDAKSEQNTLGFLAITKDAQFPGGENAFVNYISKNLKIPPNIDAGTVQVSFYIEKDGSLTNIKILKGLNKAADEEVINVLKNCPRWTPGIQNGKAMRVAFTMPVNLEYKL